MTEKEQQYIFEDWLNKHKAIVFKVVRAYAFSPTDMDDLFQEVAIQLWHSIPTFRHESAVTTWVYRISLNTAIKWVRKEQKHTRSEPLEKAPHLLQDNQIQTDERLVWLYAEVAKLNKIDRSVTLLLLDNFSYKEMAAILGISESNIGVKINRIKKHLISKSKKYTQYGI